MAKIRIGTAGWSYEDWKGTVYPPRPGARFDPLAYLAGYFDLVEVNVTFYRLPRPEVVASWLKRTAAHPGFRFVLKAPSSWTHPRRDEARATTAAFRELADLLAAGGRLGGVLLQFPWSFRDVAANRDRVEALLTELSGLPAAVEVRHGGFARGDWSEWLAARGALPVNVDQPVIGDSLPLAAIATKRAAYFRLHGRNRESWFDAQAGRDARYDYLYGEAELDEIASRIQEGAAEAAELFVVANNHFRGQAAVNALQLRARLTGERVAVPPYLLASYPGLERIALPPDRRQGELF